MGSCLGQNMVRAFVCIHYIRTLSTNLKYKMSCVSTRRILICTNLLFCLCLFFGRNTELHISKLCTFDVSRTCRVHVDPTPGHVSTSACQYKFRKSRKQDFSNLKKDNALECCRRWDRLLARHKDPIEIESQWWIWPEGSVRKRNNVRIYGGLKETELRKKRITHIKLKASLIPFFSFCKSTFSPSIC